MTINTSTYFLSTVTRLIYKSVLAIALVLLSNSVFGQFTDVQVFAGKDTAICRFSSLNLRFLGAYIRGEVNDGTWFTTGDGRFFPSNTTSGQFSITETYRPGAADINKGYVDLFLTSFDPDGIGPKTQMTQKVRLTLLFDPPMVCNTNLNVSLAANCRQEILASMLLSNMQGSVNDYTVKLFSDGKALPSNVITREYLNKTLEFKVQHNCGESNCWGYITAQDKEAPRLNCKDTTIDCTSSTLPDSLGFPVSFESITLIGNNRYRATKGDNCGDAILVYTDEVIKMSCSSTGFNERINRRWEAVDDLGNRRSCTQVIFVRARALNTIVPPSHFDDIDKPAFLCGGNYNSLPSGHPSPVAAGRPSAQGCSNLEFTYSDTKLQECGQSFKLLRKWTMIDWCTSQTRDFIQIIKVLDKTAPVIQCPDDITLTTTAYDCHTGVKELPVPQITDNCGAYTHQINLFDSLGRNQNIFLTKTGSKFFTNNLPFGRYRLEYIAVDDCENKDTCFVNLRVTDTQPPFVFCADKLVVNLNESGYLRLFPESVDQGSKDNCSIAKYEVAKMNGDCILKAGEFGPYVEFCCGDLGKTVMVSLKVTDRSGNMNTCMIEVTVRDKVPPVIVCPSHITVNCDHGIDLNNMKEFGQVVDHISKVKNIILNGKIAGKDGTATDTCGVVITEKVKDLRKCHQGQILRTFYGTDASGNTDSCTQIITVVNNDPFNKENITWPRDTTLVNCKADSIPVLITGIPKYSNEKCASVIANFEDQVFSSSEAGNCFKIIRRWKVLDWCAHERGETNSAIYHDQLIKLTNHIAPVINNTCIDTTLCIENDSCGPVNYKRDFSATDDCTPLSLMKWEWTIDINNDGTQNLKGLTRNIEANLPKGIHKVRIEVKDGCGNDTTCTYLITVKDCKAPTPYCVLSLSTAIMQNGMISVWAKDFNRGSSDNCSVSSKLKFSFSKNTTDTARIFTCDSLKNLKSREFSLQMWVTDEEGNQDHCTTLLTVQDNGNICKGANVLTNISGTVKDVHGLGVGNYSISVRDLENKLIVKKQFSTPGFIIDSVYSNTEYLLYIEKENKLGTEINVFDLLKIQRHILGIKRFISPLEFLAADVDNNQRVNVTDIIEIRKYILGIADMYDTPLKVWQFVNENHQFSNTTRPERNPDYIETGKLKSNNNQINISAYQLGNVESFGTSLSGRSLNTIGLTLESHNTVSTLKFDENTELEALQLNINHSMISGDIEVNPDFKDITFTYSPNNQKTSLLTYQAGGINFMKGDWLIKFKSFDINTVEGKGVIQNQELPVDFSKKVNSKFSYLFQQGDYLLINSDLTNYEVTIFDFNGREMLKEKIGSDRESKLSVSNIKSGYYLYKISKDKDIRSGKIYITNQ